VKVLITNKRKKGEKGWWRKKRGDPAERERERERERESNGPEDGGKRPRGEGAGAILMEKEISARRLQPP